MSKDGMEYEQTGGKKPKINVNVLERTDSSVIIRHLIYRHRVGLLILTTALLFGYILYDKFLNIFI